MTDPGWMVLHSDGSVDAYPSGWHATADGAISRAPLDLEMEPPRLADGGTVRVNGAQLETATCRYRAPTGVVGAGGHHLAIDGEGSVLVLDADTCTPVSIVGAAGATALAVDDTRLVVLDKKGRIRWYDWRTTEVAGEAVLPGLPSARCDQLRVGPDGPSVSCDGTRVLLGSGAPAAPLPASSPTLFARTPRGWSLWNPATGERATPPFGADDTNAVTDGQFAITWPDTKDRTLHGWDVASGALRWSTGIPPGVLTLDPGAIILGERGGWRLYDRDDGHLVWTVTVKAPGLDGISVEPAGPWPDVGTPSPAPTPPPPPPTPTGGRAAAAREAALLDTQPWTRDLTELPQLPTDLGAFEACGREIHMRTLGSYRVPLRTDAPTLFLSGADDGWSAPEGTDVVLYMPIQTMLATLSRTTTEDGTRRVVVWDDELGRPEPEEEDPPPFGLLPGDGMLVSGDCRILARGLAPDVVNAAIAQAYTKVGAPLPSRVASARWVTPIPDGVRHVVPLDDGTIAWAGHGATGALDADGRPLWTHPGPSLWIRGGGARLYEIGNDTVRELEPRTGDVLRTIPDATALRGAGEWGVLVERASGLYALLDAETLTSQRIMAGERSYAEVHGDTLVTGWPVPKPLVRCYVPITGGTVSCGDDPGLRLGGLTLHLGSDHVLSARRGQRVRWTLASVYDVVPGPDHTALVQLGSSSGQYAIVDSRGRLVAWLPVDGNPSAGGVGIMDDHSIVRWDP